MRQTDFSRAASRFDLGGDRLQNLFDDPRYWEGCLTKRIVGYLIDVLVLAAVSAALWVVAFSSLGLLAPLTAVVQAVLPLTYHTLMVSQRGATVGQRIAGLQVVSMTDGRNPALVQALVLTVLFYVSVAISFLPLLYGLFDDRGRLLHDIFSGTRSLRAAALAEDRRRDSLL